MDQLREALKFIQKYGFWLSCAGVALLVLGLWYYTTGDIQTQAKSYQSAINSAATSVKAAGEKVGHPNATTAEKMDEILKLYAIDVGQGWDTVYARQKAVLVWPTSLGKTFDRAVKDLRPIELIPFPTPPAQEITVRYRQQYRDFIRLEIPKLAEKIGADWTLTGASGDPSGGFSSTPLPTRGGDPRSAGFIPEAPLPLVDWSPTNQAEIMQAHFAFIQAGSPIPSTLDVLYAQETLWVLDSLVGIIKEVNGNVDARYQTSIHAIEGIHVGRSAGGVGGEVTPIPDPALAANAAAGGPMASGGYSEGGAGAMPGALPGAAPMAGEGSSGPLDPLAKVDPAAGRYVDQNYMPLDAIRLRGALAPTPASPEDVVLAVAKRMPVRLRLRIDQRKMSILLAACGNSPLPLEVRQVRINRAPAATLAGSGGGYGASPMPGIRPGGLAGEMPLRMPTASSGFGGESGRMSGGVSGSLLPDVDPHEITVEVFGIVYIFNPVNTGMLNIDPAALKLLPGAGPAPAVVAPVNETTAAPTVLDPGS